MVKDVPAGLRPNEDVEVSCGERWKRTAGGSNKMSLREAAEENIVFEKNGKIPTRGRESFPKEAFYQSKINYFLVAQFIVFAIFGAFFTCANQSEKTIFGKFFPLIFSFYGILMLSKYFSTVYEIKEKNLVIKSRFMKRLIIDYKNIIKIEKRVINICFRHGMRGRKRAETHQDTLWIYYHDDHDRSGIVMISPLEKERFLGHVVEKIIDA